MTASKLVDGVPMPMGDAEATDLAVCQAAATVLTVPVATPYQIALALNAQGAAASAAFDAAVVKAKPSDRNRWSARKDPIPADNPVYLRLCALAGLDPASLFAAAVQQ